MCALDDVRNGTPRSLAVVGEAGIGKSALLGAIAELARERRFAVRRVRAAAHERHVPGATVSPELIADLAGVVLLIDDVHWADEASTDLLLDLVSSPAA